MADYKDVFKTTKNQNWAKLAVAVYIATQGLLDFVKSHIDKFQKDLLANNSKTSAVLTCNTCSTTDVVPCPSRGICNHGKCKFHTSPPKKCLNSICNNIQSDIENEHRFKTVSWKNTDARAWCTNAWQIAKCFMPPGYLLVTTAEETDFNGLINVILNCMRFDSLLPGLLQPKGLFDKVLIPMCFYITSFLSTSVTV